MDLWWDINFYYSAATRLLRMMSQQWYQSHLYNPETADFKGAKGVEASWRGAKDQVVDHWSVAGCKIYIERFRAVVKAVWAVVSGGVAVMSGGGVRREAGTSGGGGSGWRLKFDLLISDDEARSVKFDLLISDDEARSVKFDLLISDDEARSVKFNLLISDDEARSVKFDLLISDDEARSQDLKEFDPPFH
ncbi:hypothetical protein GQ457_07G005170 [Hibiscus cannabinus]